ncbi:hypothetical protein [Yoonia sp. BS5-3]|uniref:GNAT family N-acetyltransferase n=1 Tax=Yoonia phaeophyticola TaxID=3137369 RepID=A0ABZ2V959_9RHOB
MTEISVDLATPRDLPRIQTLIRALSAFHGDDAQVTLEQLQAVFFGTPAPAIAFAARHNGQIIGYAGVLKKL